MSDSIKRTKKLVRDGSMNMTEGPILIKMIKFTVPIILTSLLQILFNAADLVVVGNFTGSSAAVAGVGCCSSLINLIVSTFMGLSIGTGVLASQAIGGGRHEEVKKIVSTTLTSSVIAGVIVGIFGFFMAKPLLMLMGTPEDVLAEAVPYMQAYFVGVPACLVYNYMASILRSTGDTRRPLIFLTIAGLANVALNFVMVAVFHLGAMGVGIATAASQFISAGLILIHMSQMEGNCRISGFNVDGRTLGKIVMIGLPSGIQGSLFSLSNVLIQSTINSYNTVIIAGNAAAVSIEGFVYFPMEAVSQTAITFVGQNMGAGKYDRIKKIALRACLLVTVIGIVLSGLVLIFGRQILSIYEPGKTDVIEAGMNRLIGIVSLYFLCGLMDTVCGLIRGMGKAIQPMIISLIGACAFRIAWVYTVCEWFPNDIMVLYVSYPVSWVLTLSAHMICFTYFYKKFKRRSELYNQAQTMKKRKSEERHVGIS